MGKPEELEFCGTGVSGVNRCESLLEDRSRSSVVGRVHWSMTYLRVRVWNDYEMKWGTFPRL